MSWYDELDETEEEEPPACSGPVLMPLNSQLNSPEPQMVVTNLFIGSFCCTFNLSRLRQLGITHVLTVCSRAPINLYTEFHCKHIQVQDDLATDLSVHFVDCISYIDQARELGAVLVHCKAGASRSASIVIAWLMHSCGFGYNDAHLLLKSRRPCISPNRAFIEQLKRFEVHLQKMKTLTTSSSSTTTGLKISSPKLNLNTTHPPSPTLTPYRPRRGSYRVPRPTLPRATPRRTNLPLSRRVNTTDRRGQNLTTSS